ncbi:MAG: fumarylacetoacetate hydrolase family protein [Ardenticatenaceae bacterium]|nr:fumarylacetoacetate hydrolase family protein [Ardenticatenaceae bacterium]
MKLVTYQLDNKSYLGAVREQEIVDLTAVAPDMLSLIEGGPEVWARASDYAATAVSVLPLAGASLLAPIPVPRRNIMCLGLNYVEHAQESYTARGQETKIPDFPIVFTKATTAVTGPGAAIPYNPAVSDKIDWEAEMGVIIGRSGKNLSPDEAMAHVFGYTIINDVSARDLQVQHKQYFKGKSLDGSCPMGPWIITADELPDPHGLNISSRVNGVTKQSSNTSLMIFNVPAILYHLSRGMTLLPGDIIATGTPSGVGFARNPPEFLSPGDVVECEVEGVGVLRNILIQELNA